VNRAGFFRGFGVRNLSCGRWITAMVQPCP
jgi:hypothetical protein